ncbi:phosphatidylserine decarboxylase family protein [Beauveria brongniartii RCEF 3172]|uniref:Phosphatidylserine decarboxylase family protein n=1 Tax=Beauveria brongniartii RCEF 3172 TaxID=1081107 RepID=A0A166XS60_9HYPO|nr:phosphatidylserine decarboxylase family protein [Beauveria brongniartii RCEF 3172]
MTVIKSSVGANSSAQGGTHEAQGPASSARWLQSFAQAVDRMETSQPLDSTVQDLQSFIESRSEVRMLASSMFDEVPTRPLESHNPGRPQTVRGYHHMLQLLNVICTQVAPAWGMGSDGLGLVGLPFYALFYSPMATPSGYAFFLRRDVNSKLKAVLDRWRDGVLKTTKSQYVITTGKDGWLCKEALTAMERDGNFHFRTMHTFRELFECDPEGDPVHWGFKTWDDFFVRKFRNIDALRPVGHPGKPEYIVNACESIPLAIKSDIKQYDTFWLKGEPYSVADMLNHHGLADRFVGGTVYQALLPGTSYHRWHSPVSGRVVDAELVEGTYFSEGHPNGFGGPDGPSGHHQVYFSHVATRALIFIEAPEPVGLMCLIALGSADVSSCEIAQKFSRDWPSPVEKGEEIGVFHFGGSGVCLLFCRGVKLAWVQEALPGQRRGNLAVRSTLAIACPIC